MRSRSEAGVTLLEMVFAAAILSVLMVGVLAAMNGSFMADRAAGNDTASQTLARRVMEECMAVAYEDLMNLNGNTTTVNGFTATVSVVQSTVDTRLIEVQVVNPDEPGGTTRLLVLRSAR